MQKRSDDTETTAINRFETFKKESLPIVDYYQNQKLLHEIYGMGGIGEIYKEIRQIIHSLKP